MPVLLHKRILHPNESPRDEVGKCQALSRIETHVTSEYSITLTSEAGHLTRRSLVGLKLMFSLDLACKSSLNARLRHYFLYFVITKPWYSAILSRSFLLLTVFSCFSRIDRKQGLPLYGDHIFDCRLVSCCLLHINSRPGIRRLTCPVSARLHTGGGGVVRERLSLLVTSVASSSLDIVSLDRLSKGITTKSLYFIIILHSLCLITFVPPKSPLVLHVHILVDIPNDNGGIG